MTRTSPIRACLSPWILIAVLATGLPAAAQQPAPSPEESRLQGVVRSAEGQPLEGVRVVVRDIGDSRVWISDPTTHDGRYTLVVPRGRELTLTALIAATGGRVTLPTRPPLSISGAVVTRDVAMPLPTAPRPRRRDAQLEGVDRLFLSFVEDTAMVRRGYVELQADVAEFDRADRQRLLAIAAVQFARIPRVEVGLRGGFADLELDGGFDPGGGATDLDLWTKFHLLCSACNRYDISFGALITLPTGDELEGLGNDALQSKLFMSMSWNVKSAVLMGHVGARATEDGTRFGVPLDGRTSAAAGLGLIVPFSESLSLAVEAAWDGERFEGDDATGEVLFGVTWRPTERGMLRVAAAAGLADASPDTRLLAGYAWSF